MRMKKLLLFAAMAAIAVSCAKTHEVNPVPGQAIGFDTWTSNLTKSTHTAFQTGATFNIYGYKQATGEEKTTVFNGEVVTLTSGGTWSYSNVRMWDRTTDSYTFYAIAPSGITSSVNAQTGAMVTNDITFTGKNADILVAKQKTVEKTNYGKTVDLDFMPQSTLFDLKVKKAKNLKEAALRVNSISIQNIQTKGHLTISAPYSGTAEPVASWSLATTPATANFDNSHGLIPVGTTGNVATIPVNVEHGVNNSSFLINNLIVMPQGLDQGQKLVINYTVTFSNETITHEREILLNKFDETDMRDDKGRGEDDQNGDDTDKWYITSWLPGKHYVYYLTINADLIVFNATISDWDDVNAFHYIIN